MIGPDPGAILFAKAVKAMTVDEFYAVSDGIIFKAGIDSLLDESDRDTVQRRIASAIHDFATDVEKHFPKGTP